MIEHWKLEGIEPSAELDRRVRRRMRASAPRQAAPFFPFEGAVYAVVLAVYALYAGARAVQVFQETRAQHVVPPVANASSRSNVASLAPPVTPRARSSRPCG